MPIVAVFDTNVLLSGLLWQGPPFHCLELARSGRVKGLTCRPILEELADVLQRKLGLESDRITECLAELLSFLSLVQIAGQLSAVIDDPDDDKVLECGVVGNASFVVTGDHRHLLPLRNFRGMQIIRPVDFLTQVRGISEPT